MITILDCYTDEPSGLGVPPYLGTYPRYLYGMLRQRESNIRYLTIDDLRLSKKFNGKQLVPRLSQRTNIATYNLTGSNADEVLQDTKELYINLGVQTPGKYLSATPGTLAEIRPLLKGYKMRKILCGPVVMGGNQLHGGKNIEKIDPEYEKLNLNFTYEQIAAFSLDGAELIKQIPDIRIIEIETGRGCARKSFCSFCTEPIKSKFMYRQKEDILSEMQLFYKNGVRYFRLGKQSSIYSIPFIVELLTEIHDTMPEIKLLHVDNSDPVEVIFDHTQGDRITKAIVQYCTSGNVGAFGVESFDTEVVKKNNLNIMPERSLKAIEIINFYGAQRGENGVPKFLPGINIIFGLMGERKETHDENMKYLRRILENFMIRRINIRQAIPFEGTVLQQTVGNSIVRKHKKWYWKWRNQIRQEIDLPMLKKVFPAGTLLTDMFAEVYDGNTTFLRQFGTYPIIVGVKGRVELKKFYSIKVKDYMLRSLVGEIA